MKSEIPRFSAGDRIRVVMGPYTGFRGVVAHAAASPDMVRVTLSFFGRRAPVTLPSSSIAPIRQQP